MDRNRWAALALASMLPAAGTGQDAPPAPVPPAKMVVAADVTMTKSVTGIDLPAKHTVVKGDTLWDLAKFYYDDHFKWRKIEEANPPPDVKDPHWIYPAQVIVIPALNAPPAAPEPAPEEVKEELLPEPQVEEAPAVVEAPPPAPEKPKDPSGMEAVPESLSTRFPDGLVGMYPSTKRFKALPGWKEDGSVVALDETESVAAAGETVNVRISGSVAAKDRFVVFRKAAPTDADKDQKATYLAHIGTIEIRRPHKGNVFRARIVSSSDPVLVGDILKKE